MSDRNSTEINAGSMADIAFLLLIFFLVTTTLDTEIGIPKRLPEKQTHPINILLKEKNVLEISINANDKILIEGHQIIKIDMLKLLVIDFIDNGSGTNMNGEKCNWCHGKKEINSSEHPEKAIIKLQTNRNTSYATYITVQNEILNAYYELRNNLANSLYGESLDKLEIKFKSNKKNKALASKIETIKTKYPQLIFEEAPLTHNMQ